MEVPMRKKLLAVLTLVLVISVFVTVGSCTPRASLRTVYAKPSEITGTYTLFLYGARHSNDIETVAILAKEGTPYTFEIYAPDFDYKVIKGMPGDKAFSRAREFVSFHHAFADYGLSKIFDRYGAVIGYEVRPYYKPLEFGYYDVLNVWYTPQNGKVIVRIHLIPEVEQQLRDGDRRRPFLFR